ncbi:translation initiation factor IF-2 N-terminal domain-containing protein, partial [Mycolicibacter sinensis]
MAKARVHELAKELGVTSKEVLARLSEQGEFVKSASSTVEAPVARRLRESFGGGKAAAKSEEPAPAAPAKSAVPAPPKTVPAGDGQAVKAEVPAAPTRTGCCRRAVCGRRAWVPGLPAGDRARGPAGQPRHGGPGCGDKAHLDAPAASRP